MLDADAQCEIATVLNGSYAIGGQAHEILT